MNISRNNNEAQTELGMTRHRVKDLAGITIDTGEQK